MVSSYLERPLRTLEQALEELERVREDPLGLGPATPAGPAVDRYDPISVLVRLLASDDGTTADDTAPPGGRRAA